VTADQDLPHFPFTVELTNVPGCARTSQNEEPRLEQTRKHENPSQQIRDDVRAENKDMLESFSDGHLASIESGQHCRGKDE
jgi:hypothetical protein